MGDVKSMTAPRRRRVFSVLRKLAAIAIITYLLVMIIMCLLENHLVFRGQTAAEHWQNPDVPIEEVSFSLADGTSISGWYLGQPASHETLLLCHGNGGNLSYRSQTLLRFRELLGCSVLIFDYPGYGKSGGRPTESSCYDSAESALHWLESVKAVPSHEVILYGESLGGGVAVEMATRHRCRALVLMKTFTRLPDVAQRMYRWLPVRLLMQTRFDNLAKIAHLDMPIFISSARNDTLVPYEMGERLFEAAREPKMFYPLAGDHDDSTPDEYLTSLRRFLDQHKAPK